MSTDAHGSPSFYYLTGALHVLSPRSLFERRTLVAQKWPQKGRAGLKIHIGLGEEAQYRSHQAQPREQNQNQQMKALSPRTQALLRGKTPSGLLRALGSGERIFDSTHPAASWMSPHKSGMQERLHVTGPQPRQPKNQPSNS